MEKIANVELCQTVLNVVFGCKSWAYVTEDVGVDVATLWESWPKCVRDREDQDPMDVTVCVGHPLDMKWHRWTTVDGLFGMLPRHQDDN